MSLSSILYVEDESDIRHIVKLILNRSDILVHDFESGVKAIDSAPKNPPDLLLLDLMMNDMDGRETLFELRKLAAYRSIPCIFFTAKADANTQAILKEIPNAEVMYKPFEMKAFVSDLEKHYDRLTLAKIKN